MKKFLLGAAALLVLAMPAAGADMRARPYAKAPVAVPPALAPIYNWTGFYVGGHVGGDWAASAGLANTGGNFLGGVQAGFDYQFAPNWVIGIEGQYSWLGGDAVTATFPNGYVYTNDRRGIASVTGRIGYTWGAGLLYVKGGYAYADNNDRLVLAGVPQAFTFDGNHKDGYTVGAGFEYMFAQNWSGKVEYQYYNFGDSRFVAPAALVPFGSFRNDEHTVKVGINYRFNLGGPVVAKY